MAEDIKWFKTHCSRWDHGGCSLLVGVEDGKITKIKGDPDGYLSKGYTCPKGRLSAERLNHPDRLQYPVKRVGERGAGKWQRLSWEEALQETAERLNGIKEKYGAKGVGFGVGMPKGLEHFILIRLANLFGSPNVIASQDICHAPREITGVHTCGFYPVADLHNPTKLVMLFASNITDTNEEGQIRSNLDEQLKNGTELIVVDPRNIELVKKAGLWLRLRPGTAHALVLGMLNVVIEEGLYDKEFVEKWTYGFEDLAQQVKEYPPEKVAEITWVPADQIRAAARKYAAAKPAAIQWGNPIEHDVNAFHVIRGLLCLMAICGNLEVAGGNINAYDPKIMGLGPFVRADLIPDKAKEMISRHYGVIPRLMTIAPAFFRRAILEDVPYPVRGYYAMCTNPMVAWADSRKTYEAFQKLEFMAVADLFMTPTAAMADIVFPVAHQFEMNDIGHYGIGHGMVLARPKIVEPPPECWPDMKIMNELGKLMSPPELWKADHEEFLADLLQPSGLTYQQFCEKGYLKGPDRFKLYEEKGFRTPTEKVELRLSTAEKFKIPALPAYDGLPEEEDPAYPLILISSKSPNYLISSYRWVKKIREREPDPFIEIHPDTATRFGIKEGDDVRIETKYGAVVQKAVVSDIVMPQVVNASIGWWFPEGDPEKQFDWEKSNFNCLTSIGKLGKEYGTPNIKNIGCRIAKV